MSRLGLIQEQAQRRGARARIALSGVSGSGKTWSALTLARALTPEGKVLVIDTERGSASLYADHFTFAALDWQPPYDPKELAAALRELRDGYDVVIIDSLSHFWEGEGGTRDIVDDAKSRAKGNSFAGWKSGAPAQNEMVEAVLATQAHVIACMRAKSAYAVDDSTGKAIPRKVGLAPIQREGIDYEFTIAAELDLEHTLTVTKSRVDSLADKTYKKGRTAELGLTLAEWLSGAAPELPADDGRKPLPADDSRERLVKALIPMGADERASFYATAGLPANTGAQAIRKLPVPDAERLLSVLEAESPAGGPESPQAAPEPDPSPVGATA